MYIGFPSKVDGVTIVGVYPLVFVGVGTGIGLDSFASVSTSAALSASSKWTRLSRLLSAADKEGRHFRGNYNLESGTIICKKTLICEKEIGQNP